LRGFGGVLTALQRLITNTVGGFFSIFKRSMKDVYRHCKTHLKCYLAEFDFRQKTAQGMLRTLGALPRSFAAQARWGPNASPIGGLVKPTRHLREARHFSHWRQIAKESVSK